MSAPTSATPPLASATDDCWSNSESGSCSSMASSINDYHIIRRPHDSSDSDDDVDDEDITYSGPELETPSILSEDITTSHSTDDDDDSSASPIPKSTDHNWLEQWEESADEDRDHSDYMSDHNSSNSVRSNGRPGSSASAASSSELAPSVLSLTNSNSTLKMPNLNQSNYIESSLNDITIDEEDTDSDSGDHSDDHDAASSSSSASCRAQALYAIPQQMSKSFAVKHYYPHVAPEFSLDSFVWSVRSLFPITLIGFGTDENRVLNLLRIIASKIPCGDKGPLDCKYVYGYTSAVKDSSTADGSSSSSPRCTVRGHTYWSNSVGDFLPTVASPDTIPNLSPAQTYSLVVLTYEADKPVGFDVDTVYDFVSTHHLPTMAVSLDDKILAPPSISKYNSSILFITNRMVRSGVIDLQSRQPFYKYTMEAVPIPVGELIENLNGKHVAKMLLSSHLEGKSRPTPIKCFKTTRRKFDVGVKTVVSWLLLTVAVTLFVNTLVEHLTSSGFLEWSSSHYPKASDGYVAKSSVVQSLVPTSTGSSAHSSAAVTSKNAAMVPVTSGNLLPIAVVTGTTLVPSVHSVCTPSVASSLSSLLESPESSPSLTDLCAKCTPTALVTINYRAFNSVLAYGYDMIDVIRYNLIQFRIKMSQYFETLHRPDLQKLLSNSRNSLSDHYNHVLRPLIIKCSHQLGDCSSQLRNSQFLDSIINTSNARYNRLRQALHGFSISDHAVANRQSIERMFREMNTISSNMLERSRQGGDTIRNTLRHWNSQHGQPILRDLKAKSQHLRKESQEHLDRVVSDAQVGLKIVQGRIASRISSMKSAAAAAGSASATGASARMPRKSKAQMHCGGGYRSRRGVHQGSQDRARASSRRSFFFDQWLRS